MATKPKIELVLTSRGNDYHCQIKGNPTIWDRGDTPTEALGNWIRTHGKDYGINISYQ